MQRVLAGTVLVAVALTLTVPAAAGQAFLTPGATERQLDPGEGGELVFSVRNALARPLSGFARVDGDVSIAAAVEPEFVVEGLGATPVVVSIAEDVLGPGRHHGVLRITVVDPETGFDRRLSANLTVTVPEPLLLFGRWAPPAPFADDAVGLFIVEAAIWIVGAYVARRLNPLVVRLVARGAPDFLRERITGKVEGPVFFLIGLYGVREAWRFFPPGGLPGAIGSVLTFFVVVVAAFLLYRALDAVLLYYMQRVAPRTPSRLDDRVVPVVRKVSLAVAVTVALFYGMSSIGLDLGFLVAGGLVIGLVLSAALGPTLTNLFAGVFIMMDRPFREGDDIRLETGEVCHVRRIGLRSTRLYYYRNHEVIVVPNTQLENRPIVNLLYPDGTYKMHLLVGVAYGSDVARVTDTLARIAHEHPGVLDGEDHRPLVLFDEFGDSALIFRLVFFVSNVRDRFAIASDIRYSVDAAFRDEGIVIPFPQRDLWMREPRTP